MEEAHRLQSEKSLLAETVKRLHKEVARLDAFKKNLLNHLNSEDEVGGHCVVVTVGTGRIAAGVRARCCWWYTQPQGGMQPGNPHCGTSADCSPTTPASHLRSCARSVYRIHCFVTLCATGSVQPGLEPSVAAADVAGERLVSEVLSSISKPPPPQMGVGGAYGLRGGCLSRAAEQAAGSACLRCRQGPSTLLLCLPSL